MANQKIGLDIGSSSTKVVSLSVESKEAGLTLERAAILDVPRVELKPERLVSFLKDEDVSGSGVNISVSGDSVVVRYIELPKMSMQELRSALRFESEKYLPFPADEIYTDAQIVEPNINEHKMRIILVGARKGIISERIGLIEKAGLSINRVTVDDFALINLHQFLGFSSEEKVCVIYNIGANISTLDVLESGIPKLSRQIMLGVTDLVRKIMGRLSMPEEKIRELLKTSGKQEVQEALDSVEEFKSQLVQELKNSLGYLDYEVGGEKSVKVIHLTGGGTYIEGIAESIKNDIGIDTQLWPQTEKINTDKLKKNRELLSHLERFSIAIGLGIKEQ